MCTVPQKLDGKSNDWDTVHVIRLLFMISFIVFDMILRSSEHLTNLSIGEQLTID